MFLDLDQFDCIPLPPAKSPDRNEYDVPQVHEDFMIVDEACHFVVKNKSCKGNSVLECKEAQCAPSS